MACEYDEVIASGWMIQRGARYFAHSEGSCFVDRRSTRAAPFIARLQVSRWVIFLHLAALLFPKSNHLRNLSLSAIICFLLCAPPWDSSQLTLFTKLCWQSARSITWTLLELRGRDAAGIAGRPICGSLLQFGRSSCAG